MNEHQILNIAKDLKKAFEEKDIEAIELIYSKDIVVWHNYDQIERNRSQSLESARWVIKEIEGFSIDDLSLIHI